MHSNVEIGILEKGDENLPHLSIRVRQLTRECSKISPLLDVAPGQGQESGQQRPAGRIELSNLRLDVWSDQTHEGKPIRQLEGGDGHFDDVLRVLRREIA